MMSTPKKSIYSSTRLQIRVLEITCPSCENTIRDREPVIYPTINGEVHFSVSCPDCGPISFEFGAFELRGQIC